MIGRVKDALVAIGIIGAVLLFIASGIITTCQSKEPSNSDILYERIMLHTGEAVMIHRGGCGDFKKKWGTDIIDVNDYIKHKNHYYCHCVNDSLMDLMSDANYNRQMALDGWCYEYYFGEEYYGQIEKRVTPYYNSVKGRNLQYVLTDDGFEAASSEDKMRLYEIEKDRFCKKYPKLKELWN